MGTQRFPYLRLQVVMGLALLHEIQRRIADRVMVAPLMQPAVVHAVGPRVAEPAIGITPLAFYPVPYEEMRLEE